MKEFDWVELIVEKEKYSKEGVHKGMRGNIDSIKGDSCLVIFDYSIDIAVDKEDLKIVTLN